MDFRKSIETDEEVPAEHKEGDNGPDKRKWWR
jgi:hypothetical protein